MKKILFTLPLIIALIMISCKMSESGKIAIYEQAQEQANKYTGTSDTSALISALGILEKKIKKSDRDYLYYLLHGRYTKYQNLYKYSRLALEDYNKAYRLNPEKYNINSDIGGTYLFLEEYENALPYLEKAYELYNETIKAPPPYCELAEAYLKMGRVDDALKINNVGLDLDSDYSWNYLQHGIILSQSGDIEILTEYFKKAIDIDSDDFMLYREYAQRLTEMGYLDKAYSCYTEWANDESDWCYADMGYILMLQGQLEKSKIMLDKAEKIDYVDITTVRYLSFYYYFMGNFEYAYKYVAKVRWVSSISGMVEVCKSEDEFFETYKNDKQFQLLLNHYQKQAME